MKRAVAAQPAHLPGEEPFRAGSIPRQGLWDQRLSQRLSQRAVTTGTAVTALGVAKVSCDRDEPKASFKWLTPF